MRIRGAVSQSKVLEPKEGREKGLPVVSIEGLSFIAKEGVPLPREGVEVDAVVQTRWREKGKRPIHYITSWEPAC